MGGGGGCRDGGRMSPCRWDEEDTALVEGEGGGRWEEEGAAPMGGGGRRADGRGPRASAATSQG